MLNLLINLAGLLLIVAIVRWLLLGLRVEIGMPGPCGCHSQPVAQGVEVSTVNPEFR